MTGIIITGCIVALLLVLLLMVLIKTLPSYSIETLREGIVIEMMLCLLFGIFTGIHVQCAENYKAIYPIDVYRGKTMLKIEYQNGVPTDSAVVWKEDKQVEYQYQ